MAARKIGVDEWRAEVERVLGRSSDQGRTTREISIATGSALRTTSIRLQILHEAGRLGCGRRAIKTRDGRDAWVPVYWIKPKGKGGGR